MSDPRRLSDADLLAWAVVLEHRRRQTHQGLKVLLLAFPPCPTCKEPVAEAQTWWVQDPIRYDGVITMQPCGHSHSATAADMERIHDHASEMLDSLRHDASDHVAGRSVEDLVREARARLGEPEQAATEATGPEYDSAVADALAAEWHRRHQRLDELTKSKAPEAQVAIVEHVRGELVGLRGALGILLGGQVKGGTADLLGWAYYQEWRKRQEGQA
jgi:hypothetical protein